MRLRVAEAYGQLASAYPQVVGLAAVWYSLILVATDDDERQGIKFLYA